MSFSRYIAIVFLANGLYHQFDVPPANAKKLKTFMYHGHKYRWSTDSCFRLVGWYPWQKPTINPFIFLYQWLQRRFISVGFIVYHEPSDPFRSVSASPDEKLLGPTGFTDFVTQDRVNPALFRTAVKSKLYDYYQKSKFGKHMKMGWTLIIVIAIVFIIVLLYSAGIIHITPPTKVPP